jgi:branched-chain amino acid transport system ATP-binding protein
MSILKADHITIRFGGLTAVSDFYLNLEEGELVGLIGPNGAGKTTVFNMITGGYKPIKGSIYFNGQEITRKRIDEITALGIARTFQNIRLFTNLSVLDNVMVGCHLRLKSSVLNAIFYLPQYSQEESYMREEAEQLLKEVNLEKLETNLAGGLPYGQQRKLEIARALATRPKLLLLDEPAAGMNPLDYGITIAEGNPVEIQHNPEVIKAYLGVEAHYA